MRRLVLHLFEIMATTANIEIKLNAALVDEINRLREAVTEAINLLGEVTEQRDEALKSAEHAKAYKRVMKLENRNLRQQLAVAMSAISTIEERYIDGCDTYEDWKFMGDTARTFLEENSQAQARPALPDAGCSEQTINRTMNTPTPRTDRLKREAVSANRFSPEMLVIGLGRILNEIPDLERELTAVTEQRDEARKLAEKYRYLSCESQEEADAEVLPWENNQPTKP